MHMSTDIDDTTNRSRKISSWSLLAFYFAGFLILAPLGSYAIGVVTGTAEPITVRDVLYTVPGAAIFAVLMYYFQGRSLTDDGSADEEPADEGGHAGTP
jgi:hypothetical protein